MLQHDRIWFTMFIRGCKIKCNWQKWLPPDVYKFLELTQKEVNAAVEL